MVKGKRGMETEIMTYWIIGLIVFLIIAVSIIILTGKGNDALNFFKDLLRYRGA